MWCRASGFVLLGCCLLSAIGANAQEWTRFRGPNGTGISEVYQFPPSWQPDSFIWQTDLPGLGHSSPVVWGDKIFLTSATEDGRTRWLLCLSLDTGKLLWKQEFAGESYHIHRQNSFATSTPAVDDQRIYTLVVSPHQYKVVAHFHNGSAAWEKELGTFAAQHGFGTSPIVHNGMVIVPNDQDGTSFIVALDAATGREIWRLPRTAVNAAYSTPCVRQLAGDETELIFCSEAHGISAVNAATGKLNWELPVFEKRAVSSPLLVDDLVFGSCGSGGGGSLFIGIRPGSSNKPEVAVRLDRQIPYVPTAVARDDLLFLWTDTGIVSCIELPDGQLLWQKRVGGNFNASPIRAKDHLYAVSVEGDIVCLAADREYAELGRTPLDDVCRSTPAIVAGKMLVRTQSKLVALPAERIR